MISLKAMTTIQGMLPSPTNSLMITKMLEADVEPRLKEFHNYLLPNRTRRKLAPTVMNVVELGTLY